MKAVYYHCMEAIRFSTEWDTATPGRVVLQWYCSDRTAWAQVLSQVQSLPGRLFLPGEKAWSIPLNREARKQAEAIGFSFDHLDQPVVPPTQAVPKGPGPAEIALSMVDRVPLDPDRTILEGLYSYQIQFLRYMVWRNGRGCNGDDMGVGKTVQALAWLCYADLVPALIVVNSTTKPQWIRQWARWIPRSKGYRGRIDMLEGRTPRELDPNCSYVINWEILADWTGHLNKNNMHFIPDGPLSRVPFKLLIGDEVQAIGNPSSTRSKAFRALSRRIPGLLPMSGTPARSKVSQFWPILNILEPKQFSNYRKFQYRYCDPKATPYGMEFNGATHVEELHQLIAPLIIRRMKEDVRQDLPPITVDVVPLAISTADTAKYKAEEDEAFGQGLDRAERRERVKGLLRSAYALKERAALQWIREFLDVGSNKLIVFCWHVDVVDMVLDSLKDFNPAKINGDVTGNKRDAQVQKFIQDPSCRLMVSNIQAGGVGLDGLQAVCSHFAFLEFSHTPKDHSQAGDRLHRGGQENPVNGYYLVAPNTVDEDAIEVLDRRAQMLDSVLEGRQVQEQDLLTEILARRGF